jgi:serine/threonine protein kinase
MLTRDGAKVLDFGLAKSGSKPGPTEETLTKVLTTEGTVMGTPQYMAPEQFEGKEADARSDIWAFGAVLYEMVTGQKAFQGKSYSSLLGAILSADPPPMSVKPFTPSWLERLVKRCLNKDPEDRWQSMRDVVIELQTPPQESAAVGSSKAARWPWAVILPWAVAALFAIAAGFASWSARSGATAALAVERFSIDLPDADAVVPDEGHPILAISPDGSRLAYNLPAGRLDSLHS